MRHILAVGTAAALVLLSTGAIVTAEPVAVAAASPARLARGIELAKLMNSEAATMGQLSQVLSVSLPKSLAADPTSAEVEKAYPGVTKAMIVTMQPMVEDYLRQSLPEMWRAVGTLYAESLTEAEIAEVLDFLTSDAGRSLIARKIGAIDTSAYIDRAVKGDTTMQVSDLKGINDAATKATVSELTPSELVRVAAFGSRPSTAKLGALNPQVMKVVADWANRPTPELDKRLEAAAAKVVTDFVRTADTAAGATK